MRVLLDESVPKALGFSIQGHFVRTVQVAGFAGMFNGELLAAMEVAAYDVLITFDLKTCRISKMSNYRLQCWF